MRVGVFLQICDLESGRAFPVDEVAERAREVEELGFDSVWVMDHILMEGQPGVRAPSHDPMVLLTAMALRTTHIPIGSLVINASPLFRHPAVLARQAASVQDISAGRFTLGLGAGWHEPEFTAHGIPMDHLVGRFESTLQALMPLLHSADTVVRATPAPSILIGGSGPRMLRLTAQFADAWNQCFGGPDATWYDDLVKKLCAALREQGRPESEVERTVGISVLPVEGKEIELAFERARRFARSERDVNFLTGSPREIADGIKRYGDAGADHVIIQTSNMSVLGWDPAYLRRAAEALPYVR